MSYSTENLIKAINHQALKDKIMGPVQAQGFTLAVLSAPALIPTQDWWPMLFVEQKISSEIDDDARDEFIRQIMGYFQQTVDSLKTEAGFQFPDNCACESGNANAELKAYAAGFLQGYHWLSDLWGDRLSNLGEDAKELVSQVLVGCMVLSGHPSLPQMLKDRPKDQIPSPDQVFKDLPKGISYLALFGRKIAAAEAMSELKANK